MTRTPWSPRFAWDRRPGGKYDGAIFVGILHKPDNNTSERRAGSLSSTARGDAA